MDLVTDYSDVKSGRSKAPARPAYSDTLRKTSPRASPSMPTRKPNGRATNTSSRSRTSLVSSWRLPTGAPVGWIHGGYEEIPIETKGERDPEAGQYHVCRGQSDPPRRSAARPGD